MAKGLLGLLGIGAQAGLQDTARALSTRDKWAIIGATLHDVGNAGNPAGQTALSGLDQSFTQRAQQQAMAALAQSYFGPQGATQQLQLTPQPFQSDPNIVGQASGQMVSTPGAGPTAAERLAYVNDPKGWADAQFESLKPYTLDAGQIRGVNGRTVQGAPKQTWDGGQAYSFDPATGAIRFLGQRAPSYEESTTAANSLETGRHNLATESLTGSAQTETGRHNRVDEATAAKNAATEAARAAKEGQNNNGGLPAGWVIK